VEIGNNWEEELLQGKRFENAVWRRWGQQLFGVAGVERADQFMPMMYVHWIDYGLSYADGCDRPTGRTWREKDLLVPIVVSQGTFHNKHELSFVQPTLDERPSLLVNGKPHCASTKMNFVHIKPGPYVDEFGSWIFLRRFSRSLRRRRSRG
jgi:hypothetical protein